MSQDKFAGGQEVQANWYKFDTVGDGIKGTLVGKHFQKGNAQFGDQWVYEIKTEDEGIMNVGISTKKEGTVQRLNKCKMGEIVGVLFEKEGEPPVAGFHPAKYLKVLTFGIDPNYNAFAGGEEVAGETEEELPNMYNFTAALQQ
jgi:hypothetical protein